VILAQKLFEARNGQFDNNYMSIKNCVDFSVKALDHTDGQVREASIAYLAIVHKAAIASGQPPTYVRRLLPKSPEDIGRWDLLWRNVYDNLDRAEGKPTAKELADARLREVAQAEEKKKNEIQNLQDQIAELKTLQTQHAGGNHPVSSANTNNSNNRSDALVRDSGEGVNEENVCIFCGERNDDFIGDDEKGLDLHYWKYCPMLKRCEYCGQVTEIPAFHEHILIECEARQQGKIPDEIIALMTKEKNSKVSHCSLCKKKVDGTEEGWQRHLMGEKGGCLANPRRIPFINRMKAQKQDVH